jgi:hypothetical protein
MDYTELKAATKELDAVLDKHAEVFKYAGIYNNYNAKLLLMQIEVAESFGVGLRESTQVSPEGKRQVLSSLTGCIPIDNERAIRKISEGNISWSDDGSQPSSDGEWLYMIRFPTGAYFFHSDYPTDLFNEFFNDLKSYNPKYSDTHNHVLYFDKDSAKAVHHDYGSVLKDYREKVSPYIKKAKADKLRAELEKLEN